MATHSYTKKLHTLLSPDEHRVFKKLSSPEKIQDYLDSLPINFEPRGETLMSPRRVIREHTAHCIEGALFAAASLAYHGARPLILDFQTVPDDEDHVVTAFTVGKYWGALSKTNHAVLRYRDPIYKSVRELAMSYAHEYFQWDRQKTLRAYSRPFDMRAISPEKWIIEEEDMWWFEKMLDASPHTKVIPKDAQQKLRPASKIEIETLKIVEWDKSGKRLIG